MIALSWWPSLNPFVHWGSFGEREKHECLRFGSKGAINPVIERGILVDLFPRVAIHSHVAMEMEGGEWNQVFINELQAKKKTVVALTKKTNRSALRQKKKSSSHAPRVKIPLDSRGSNCAYKASEWRPHPPNTTARTSPQVRGFSRDLTGVLDPAPTPSSPKRKSVNIGSDVLRLYKYMLLWQRSKTHMCGALISSNRTSMEIGQMITTWANSENSWEFCQTLDILLV